MVSWNDPYLTIFVERSTVKFIFSVFPIFTEYFLGDTQTSSHFLLLRNSFIEDSVEGNQDQIKWPTEQYRDEEERSEQTTRGDIEA